MSFAQSLAARAVAVEARLAALLDEKSLAGEAPDAQSARLIEAMRHAALGGGKRLRPFLLMETAALFGVPDDQSIDAAVAVECIHCYSLTHDDLPAMDHDEVRRGQPTVWRKYDEWTAILAGDGLLTLAFDILARPGTHADPAIRVGLIGAIARASGVAGMVGGQSLDLMADKLGIPSRPSAQQIRRLQAMKTGALIRVSCEAGAILAGAPDAHRQHMVNYGEALGLAFQMADDLLDAQGDAATVGKAVAKDAAAGKATLVSLMGIEAVRAELAKAEQSALDALAAYGLEGDILREAARFVVNRRN